jgi:predicted dehydrogenase
MMNRKMTRREALRTGTGWVAGAMAPMIVPSSVLGLDAPAPSNKITVGCIGTGGMGSGNMNSFLGQDDCRVVAVCDVKRQAAENARNAVNGRYQDQGCQAYGDFRELLARPDIDAIMLATPDHWHGTIAVAAARAGKDIYGEKPLAHSYLEGRRIADAVRRYGRVWQTGSWQRSTHNFARACELVRNGRVGKVHTIEVGLPVDKTSGQDRPYTMEPVPEGLDYDFWVGPARWMPYHREFTSFNWRWNLNFGGGALMDWVGHHLDIAHWGMGWDETGPIEIEGWGEYQTRGIFDAAYKFRATLKYPGGVTVIMAGNDGLAGGAKWIGDKGWVRVDRDALEANPAEILKEQLGPGEMAYPRSPGHHRNFLDCIRSRRPTMTPAETAHRSAGPGHLAQIAMRLGRKLRFDPAKEEVLNDPTAQQMLGRALRAPWSV